jgi:hypothetical protein
LVSISKVAQQIPASLTEAPLYFRPTYKFDHGRDIYDTSSKQRIPSWTDRILFKPEGTSCLAYNSVTDLRSSDHRPVYASFAMELQVPPDLLQTHQSRARDPSVARGSAGPEFTSESQVCAIM